MRQLLRSGQHIERVIACVDGDNSSFRLGPAGACSDIFNALANKLLVPARISAYYK
jgi:hypothetical protein